MHLRALRTHPPHHLSPAESPPGAARARDGSASERPRPRRAPGSGVPSSTSMASPRAAAGAAASACSQLSQSLSLPAGRSWTRAMHTAPVRRGADGLPVLAAQMHGRHGRSTTCGKSLSAASPPACQGSGLPRPSRRRPAPRSACKACGAAAYLPSHGPLPARARRVVLDLRGVAGGGGRRCVRRRIDGRRRARSQRRRLAARHVRRRAAGAARRGRRRRRQPQGLRRPGDTLSLGAPTAQAAPTPRPGGGPARRAAEAMVRGRSGRPAGHAATRACSAAS